MGVWRQVTTLLVLGLCATVLADTIIPAHSKGSSSSGGSGSGNNKEVKKSRRKRRGCKCIHRYMSSVEKMMDAKLKEFKDVYLLPKLNERKSSPEMQRMRDMILKMAGDVSETKNALRIMTANMDSMLEDLSVTSKNHDALSTKIGRVDRAVANLTKHVDTLEERVLQQTAMEVTTLSDEGTTDKLKEMPSQCQEVAKHGGMKFRGDYYIMIKPHKVKEPFKALCKMVNNSGWTVIQKRVDGSVDFFRKWKDYREGFGTLEGEFWLGLDNIHYLTAQEDTMLRIEMEDWTGKTFFAVYDHFRVDGLSHKYRLHISGYHGNAGDSMTSVWENHDGMAFSTVDEDNDLRYYDSCAKHYSGAWWFSNCFEAHLNGKYYFKGSHQNYFQRDGIQWNSIHMYSSLKAVSMMIKPTDGPRDAPPAHVNEVNEG